MYAITGASGKTGKSLAQALLKAGKKVRVLGRDAANLKSLVDQGAEARIGSLNDPEFLSKAFAGVEAAYLLVPPDMGTPDILAHYASFGGAMAKAVNEARVPYAIHLSSLGAHTPVGTGPVAGLFYQERRLNKLPHTHVLHLRPTYFMENLLGNVGMVQAMGIIGAALRPDVKMSFIATADIGAYAAKRMLALDFTGKEVQELIGQRDLTPQEVATAIGNAIGKPDLKWVQFPYDDAYKAMVGMGISASMAQSFVDLQRTINNGGYDVVYRDAENTTPTTIETFAQTIFANVYKAGGSGAH